MAIVFHCEFCRKKISAPDEAGGRRGRCPHCSQHVFVPPPTSQVEEIPLSPVDPQEEERRRLLRQEELRVLNQLHEHKEAPEGARGPAVPDSSADDNSLPFAVASSGPDTKDLVLQYLLAMAKGELGSAESLEQQIAAGGPKALKVVEQLAMQEFMHPQLANVPPTVISGFFKRLLSQFPK